MRTLAIQVASINHSTSFTPVLVYYFIAMATDGSGQIEQIAALLQQISQQEKLVQLENKRLNQLMTIQDALIQKQRASLQEVSATATSLRAVEAQRAKLRAQLSLQKSKLLVSASESKDASSLIDETLAQGDIPPLLSTGAAGVAALKVVETLQANMMAMLQDCIKSPTLSVPSERVMEVILDINEVLQKLVDAGIVKESPENTIRRQAYVIQGLDAGADDEVAEDDEDPEEE